MNPAPHLRPIRFLLRRLVEFCDAALTSRAVRPSEVLATLDVLGESLEVVADALSEETLRVQAGAVRDAARSLRAAVTTLRERTGGDA